MSLSVQILMDLYKPADRIKLISALNEHMSTSVCLGEQLVSHEDVPRRRCLTLSDGLCRKADVETLLVKKGKLKVHNTSVSHDEPVRTSPEQTYELIQESRKGQEPESRR